jgi:hypothetical protein
MAARRGHGAPVTPAWPPSPERQRLTEAVAWRNRFEAAILAAAQPNATRTLTVNVRN